MNRDKKQFFDCGLIGLNNRFDRIGTEPGSRALALLLSDHGTWKGDRIAVVGDTSEEFEDLVNRGVNVEVEAELMLIEFDGLFLGQLEEQLDMPGLSTDTFMRLCVYAWFLRHPRITELLNRKYGTGQWQQQYEKHLRANADHWSEKVIDAKNRGLNLLKRPAGAE